MGRPVIDANLRSGNDVSVPNENDVRLSVTGMAKSFMLGGDRRLSVLDGVSFDVRRGEVMSVIGPSGAGKTTLLRAIAGLEPFDGGSVKVDGVPVVRRHHDIFSIVFQDVRLLPWKTVRDNVELALRLKHHRRLTAGEKASCAEYIDAVGLSAFAENYPHQLSGGMQQRVGLARALVRTPQVLLLDEPFGALDAQTRLAMQEFFLKVLERFDLTAMLVTHDIEEAVFMGTACLLLAGQPARVMKHLRIDLPSPRYAEATRQDTRLLDYRAELWSDLRTYVVRGEEL
jgi:NitT/TauT family transport system ATP-binding protein